MKIPLSHRLQVCCSLIQPGDRIAVCISGGKDSMLLAKLLQEVQRHGKMEFELKFLSMDPGYSDRNREKLLSNAKLLGISLHMFHTDIFDIVHEVDGNPCYLCARMRRGYLYKNAQDLGCNKIALGHHLDDAIETFYMNLWNEGRIGTFSPVTYLSRVDLRVIRPLLYCPEKEIRAFAAHTELPVVSSACPADENTQRENMKRLLRDLERENRGLRHRIFGAMQRGEIDGFHLPDRRPLVFPEPEEE